MEEAQAASRTLSELELLGLVRREFGGGTCGACEREERQRRLGREVEGASERFVPLGYRGASVGNETTP